MATEHFLNPEDFGEYLNFRVLHEGNTIPVTISREALDDHFHAQALGSLLQAYINGADAINARAQAKALPGGVYTVAQPLRLTKEDF